MVMAALVVEHEQAHRLRLARQQAGVHDQHAGRRNAEIGQPIIEHVAHRAALERTPGHGDGAVALQADW
jgi:hypothetical protein